MAVFEFFDPRLDWRGYNGSRWPAGIRTGFRAEVMMTGISISDLITQLPGLIEGLVEGEEVAVVQNGKRIATIRKDAGVDPNWGDGIRQSAGAMAVDTEFDDVFNSMESERRKATHRENHS